MDKDALVASCEEELKCSPSLEMNAIDVLSHFETRRRVNTIHPTNMISLAGTATILPKVFLNIFLKGSVSWKIYMSL
jgi:hypothetical protein